MTCPICHAAGVRPAFERNGLRVWRCAACGGEFLFPQPSDEELSRIYSSSYFFRNDSKSERDRRSALKSATAKLYLDMLQVEHPPVRGRRLLEIGCGTGDFLVEASAHGYEVTGVEISPSSVETAARRLASGALVCGTLESAGFPSESFDIVATSDVIEHVRDPIGFLREIHRILQPGGTLLLVTPSLDSWSHKLLRRWWMEYKTEHLYYFGNRSLLRALRETGFEEARIMPNEKVLSLDYVAAHFERFPVPLFTPLVTALSRVMPTALVHRPVRIVASGITAIARKAS